MVKSLRNEDSKKIVITVERDEKTSGSSHGRSSERKTVFPFDSVECRRTSNSAEQLQTGSGQIAKPSGPAWANRIVPVVFLIIGVFLMFHPMILSNLARVQTDAGDPRFANYMLEHSYQWISGNPQHRRFWDPPIFFPTVNTGAYSESLLGAAPLYWIFRVVGILPDTSFQLWMIAAAALNFVAMFSLLRRCMGLSALAATGGAYMFAFAGMRVSLLNGPHLLPQFFSVFAVVCLFRIFGRAVGDNLLPSRKPSLWIPLFFLSVVLQLYAGVYLGFFLGFGLLLSLVIALLLQDARHDLIKVIRENLAVFALSCLGCAAALSWMAYHYFITQLVFGSPTWSEVGGMLPHLTSWINMGHAKLAVWLDDHIP